MVFWTRSPLIVGASALTENGQSCTPSAASPGLMVSALKSTAAPARISLRCRFIVS